MDAPPPSAEQDRLRALRRYTILDTPPEDAFDRITRLAARIFSAPIALVSLVDEQRQWFKSCFGIDLRQASRTISFCAHAILSDEVMVVPDARRDARFAANPLVTGAPGVRFYAGASLKTPDGFNLGTLCVIDTVPRNPSPEQLVALTDLAATAMDVLESRLGQERLATVVAHAPVAVFMLDQEGALTLFEGRGLEVLGQQSGDVVGRSVFDLYRAVPEVQASIRRALAGETFATTVTVRGFVYHTRFVPVRDESGAIARVVGVTTDITERAHSEQTLRESEQRLFRIIETTAEGMVILDRQGRFSLANSAAERLLGVPRERIIGSGFEAPTWRLLTMDGEPFLLQEHSFVRVRQTRRPVLNVEFIVERIDGTRVALSANAAPLWDADGSFAGTVTVLSDITDRKQAEQLRAGLLAREQEARAAAESAAQRLRDLLSIIDATLAHAGDADAVLQALAERVAGALGVYAASVRLLDETDGRFHVRASFTTTGEPMSAVPLLPGEGIAGKAAAEGRPVYVADVTAPPWHGRSRVQMTSTRSMLAVPMRVGGRVIGVLNTHTRAVREFTPDEIRLLEIAADRAAAVAEQARLYAAERQARTEAEAGERRLRFLTEASVALASSLEYETTLESIARLTVPALADRCTIHMVEEDGTTRWVASAAADPEKGGLQHELYRRYPPDLSRPYPVSHVMQSGRAEILPQVPEEALVAAAKDAEHLRMLQELGFGPSMAVPLTTGGRTLGVIMFISAESGRRYGPADLALAEELARRAALAVDSARVHREARETARREQEHARHLRMLAQASLAIGSAISMPDLLDVATKQARAIIGAHLAGMCVLTDGDWSRAETAVSLSDEYEAWRNYWARVDGSGIYALVCGENRPMRITRAELESHPAWRGFGREAADHPPMRGWMAAPLVGRDGSNLGLIQLSDKEEGDFTEEDESILVQLAQLASAAIENARLQQQAASAAAAMESDRFKTDLLNTVSHELRTPLAAIKGFSTTLLSFSDRLPREDRLSFLQEIDSAADRLTELVDNLLHLARLESGSLKIVRAPVAVASVLEAAVAESRIRHPDRVITLDMGEELPHVSADDRRLRQVVANLIDNAVKYSPGGGEVDVRAARAADGGVTLSVTDRGIGIPPEHLGRLFQRFYRVDSGPAREIGGTGLGLAICRHIVEEHGGRIEVVSTPGAGSTFTVTLPPPAGT